MEGIIINKLTIELYQDADNAIGGEKHKARYILKRSEL